MSYANRAEEIFSSGLNCAQAVAGAFFDLYEDISEETVFNLTSPLGGGFGRMRELCGAVSGMGIAYGLIMGTHTTEEKFDTYSNTAALAASFIERYESIVCRELLEKRPNESLTPRETALSDEEKLNTHWPCSDYIRGAVQILEEMLKAKGIIEGN